VLINAFPNPKNTVIPTNFRLRLSPPAAIARFLASVPNRIRQKEHSFSRRIQKG
jgi:hypothetical protein